MEISRRQALTGLAASPLVVMATGAGEVAAVEPDRAGRREPLGRVAALVERYQATLARRCDIDMEIDDIRTEHGLLGFPSFVDEKTKKHIASEQAVEELVNAPLGPYSQGMPASYLHSRESQDQWRRDVSAAREATRKELLNKLQAARVERQVAEDRLAITDMKTKCEDLDTELKALEAEILCCPCHSLEDVQFKLAFWVESGCVGEDVPGAASSGDTCDFVGGVQEFTQIMKDLAGLTQRPAVDMVQNWFAPTPRHFGY